MPHETLQWWHFNVPVDQRTEECPDYLITTSEKDQKSIAVWHSDYVYVSWEEVKYNITINRIDLFRREPIDLRNYRQFVHHINGVHGTINNFVLQNRLRWTDQVANGAPFQCPQDWQILCNDWPYGFEPGIVHLLVWTKFSIPEHPITGDVTPEGRKMVDDFVAKAFGQVIGDENVRWFRNWKNLKSVNTVEHFHVLLNNPPPAFVADITQGDIPCRDAFVRTKADICTPEDH